jgi:uncharacterized protein
MEFKPLNPFLLTTYGGPEYFCDRIYELERLTSNILNGVNTTLLSIRRMGKTGLLKHLAQHLESQGITALYLDIYATQNLREFTLVLLNGIFDGIPQRSSLGKQFMTFIKKIRATVSFDSMSGQPQLGLEFVNNDQYIYSLKSLFQLLEKQEKPIVLLIDEFQQIANYPEKTMEALLRTHIQQLKYTRFVFSGSNKHLLTSMFGDQSRPFYMSTQLLELQTIDELAYREFIIMQFAKGGRTLSEEVMDEIIRFSRLHTFYTQAVCNRLYGMGHRKIKLNDLHQACNQLLKEQESVFFQYRHLLTAQQWKLLEAIALEGRVYNPTSAAFIKKYDLGAASAVQRSLAALEHKEMIYRQQAEKGSYLLLYDVFLSRWLERTSYHPQLKKQGNEF